MPDASSVTGVVRKAEILVITNRKGGTGKTTTSVNLAAEFAATGQRVLLIDLDTQSHCAVGLDVSVRRGEATVHDLLLDDTLRLRPVIRQTQWPGLDLVPADPLFDHGTGHADQTRLARALREEGLLQAYDLILIDTPPSLDMLLMNALVAAHRVLVPFVPHALSNEGIKSLARVLFKVSAGANPDLRLLGFLPLMVDRRIGHHRGVTEGVSHQFGARRMLSGVRGDIKLVDAFAHRMPVRYHAPRSRGAEDYAQAAREVAALLAS